MATRPEPVPDLAWSADGSRIATVGADDTVRIWHPKRAVEMLVAWRGTCLDLDWSHILHSANSVIAKDGNEFFSIIIGLMFFKGVLASLAGGSPSPGLTAQGAAARASTRSASATSDSSNAPTWPPIWCACRRWRFWRVCCCSTRLSARWRPC